MTQLRVALIPGDGIGSEVVPEARKVVDALGLEVRWTELPWGSQHLRETGVMMPPSGLETLRRHDAALLGAVGDPGVPDHQTLWGLLLPIRQGLDLWANLRPVRLLDGVQSPLARRGPDDIDMIFVRENSEGEYAGAGGRAHAGLPHEVGVEVAVFTRSAIKRLARFSFELARSRSRRLASATKSNAARHGYVLWDEVVEEVAGEYPEVELERVLVDALAARMVTDPASLDVIVASNLFGDILTDLGAAIQGGMGMAASANVAPGTGAPGVFEPVHGSAPDIAGQGVANPFGAIWSAALMLEHLGRLDASRRVLAAMAQAVAEGVRTPDLGGTARTAEVGDAVAAASNN